MHGGKFGTGILQHILPYLSVGVFMCNFQRLLFRTVAVIAHLLNATPGVKEHKSTSNDVFRTGFFYLLTRMHLFGCTLHVIQKEYYSQ